MKMIKGGVGMAKKETDEQVVKEQQPAAEAEETVLDGEAKAKKKKPPNAPESLKKRLILWVRRK